MARVHRFAEKEYDIASEIIHFQTQTDANFYNTVAGVDKQIVTVIGGAKEEGAVIGLTASQAGAMTPAILTYTGVSSGSVTGMTVVTSNTIRLTKRGRYDFRLNCSMGATDPPYVIQFQSKIGGVLAESQTVSIAQKENALTVNANYLTSLRWDTDATRDITFLAGVDNVPTGGALPTFSGELIVSYVRVT